MKDWCVVVVGDLGKPQVSTNKFYISTFVSKDSTLTNPRLIFLRNLLLKALWAKTFIFCQVKIKNQLKVISSRIFHGEVLDVRTLDSFMQ